jgi:hypothetical protein
MAVLDYYANNLKLHDVKDGHGRVILSRSCHETADCNDY